MKKSILGLNTSNNNPLDLSSLNTGNTGNNTTINKRNKPSINSLLNSSISTSINASINKPSMVNTSSTSSTFNHFKKLSAGNTSNNMSNNISNNIPNNITNNISNNISNNTSYNRININKNELIANIANINKENTSSFLVERNGNITSNLTSLSSYANISSNPSNNKPTKHTINKSIDITNNISNNNSNNSVLNYTASAVNTLSTLSDKTPSFNIPTQTTINNSNNNTNNITFTPTSTSTNNKPKSNLRTYLKNNPNLSLLIAPSGGNVNVNNSINIGNSTSSYISASTSTLNMKINPSNKRKKSVDVFINPNPNPVISTGNTSSVNLNLNYSNSTSIINDGNKSTCNITPSNNSKIIFAGDRLAEQVNEKIKLIKDRMRTKYRTAQHSREKLPYVDDKTDNTNISPNISPTRSLSKTKSKSRVKSKERNSIVTDASSYINNYNKSYSKKNSLTTTPSNIANANKSNIYVNNSPTKKDYSPSPSPISIALSKDNLHLKKYSLTRNITRKNSNEELNNILKDIPIPESRNNRSINTPNVASRILSLNTMADFDVDADVGIVEPSVEVRVEESMKISGTGVDKGANKGVNKGKDALSDNDVKKDKSDSKAKYVYKGRSSLGDDVKPSGVNLVNDEHKLNAGSSVFDDGVDVGSVVNFYINSKDKETISRTKSISDVNSFNINEGKSLDNDKDSSLLVSSTVIAGRGKLRANENTIVVTTVDEGVSDNLTSVSFSVDNTNSGTKLNNDALSSGTVSAFRLGNNKIDIEGNITNVNVNKNKINKETDKDVVIDKCLDKEKDKNNENDNVKYKHNNEDLISTINILQNYIKIQQVKIYFNFLIFRKNSKKSHKK
jgi:hypothetical protein